MGYCLKKNSQNNNDKGKERGKKEGSGRCWAWGLEFTVILKANLALT